MNGHILEFQLFGNLVVVTPWKFIGAMGAILFGMRWVVQLYCSRKAGRPITPRLFWILSLLGSFATLAYFIFSPKQDMVGVMQNLFPLAIASYNLYLDARPKTEPAPRVTVNAESPAPALTNVYDQTQLTEV